MDRAAIPGPSDFRAIGSAGFSMVTVRVLTPVGRSEVLKDPSGFFSDVPLTDSSQSRKSDAFLSDRKNGDSDMMETSFPPGFRRS